MRVNLNLSKVNAKDTIIVANNRQVLAIKKSIIDLKGASKMPKVFSYKSWLERHWNQNNASRKTRLLSQLELRFILKEICKNDTISNPELFIDELIKSYSTCKSYLIDISKLSNFNLSPTGLFIKWIKQFDDHKKTNKYIDYSDLLGLSLDSINNKNYDEKFYSYGFNEPTPEQQKLFKTLDCIKLPSLDENNNSPNYSFNDQESELRTIAQWARDISKRKPDKSIGIVIPNLNELQHNIKTIFDFEFDSNLVETHQKPYNISLGIPLGDYPISQNLLSILKISSQFKGGFIERELFIKVATSPYIKGAFFELDKRALLVNNILKSNSLTITSNKVLSLLENCPLLKEIFIELNKDSPPNTIFFDDALDSIGLVLDCWGFTTDRTLSSTEYQVFEKYQIESLILNKLSSFYKKTSFADAIEILKNHMNAVIFQPKSGSSNIHILGSLEAEGLYFDYAWVSSMTSNLIPGKLRMLPFIPPKISVEFNLPSSSFELVSKESKTTLQNLTNLSCDTVFSYPKIASDREQLPSPFISFIDFPNQPEFKKMVINLELIEDFKAPKIVELSIKKGVKVLQDQMGCSFKGFSNRLNIERFEEPHIGLSRLEQGNLIHTILENFFNEVQSSAELSSLNEKKLEQLIDKHTESAIQKITQLHFRANEKSRLLKTIHDYISLEKERDYFKVIRTESESEVIIKGLKFSTRIDRMDQNYFGSKLIIDYKTGKNFTSSDLIGDPIKQAQLPIYAITNSVEGIAFASINSNNCEYKGITKNPFELPISKQASNRMPEWSKQITAWTSNLNLASIQFQDGAAEVLPAKGACDFCDYDLLCRVEKLRNN